MACCPQQTKKDTAGGGTGSSDARAAACAAKYGFDTPDPAGAPAPRPALRLSSTQQSITTPGGDDCPTTICGLNGAWLGKGIRFRTLHLDRTPNEQGLAIHEFKIKNKALIDTPLTLEVDGDHVRGRDASGNVYEGEKLVGAELGLIRVRPNEAAVLLNETYTMRFEGYRETDFLAQPSGAAGDLGKVPLYQFSVTSGEGCKVELCKPGLNEDDPRGVTGTAVIFRGDLYDEKTFAVEAVAPSDDGRGSIFNIACLGTAISKVHLLRHTTASQVATAPGAAQPTVPQRQALLRMLTADYCGNGHPFTEDGLPIRLDINSLYRPTIASRYVFRDAASIDARWNENGATCIGNPRWIRGRVGWTEPTLRTEIQRICGAAHPLAACPDTLTPLVSPFNPSSYGISGNPPVPVSSTP